MASTAIPIHVGEHQATTARRHPAADPPAGATLVLGHGAGADQRSRFLVRFAEGLAARGLDVVTFNFLYTEQGRRVPDRGDRLEACYRAVLDHIVRSLPAGARLVIGGKSMGGRIASQIAANPDPSWGPRLAGLVFFGYPLHPPGRPDRLRASHLPDVGIPMLFVQGSRDAFGTPDEIRAVLDGLGVAGTIAPVAGADHSLGVGRSRGAAAAAQAQVYEAAMDAAASWIRSLRSEA